MDSREVRDIELEGLVNARAIGAGTPWLIRSAAPDALTPAAARTLRGLGIAAILDLREPHEGGAPIHRLPVRSVPLYGAEPPQAGRLEDIYEGLLRRRGAALAEAVGVIAAEPRGVMVHCTAGKDRTGLVVALARLAAGASRRAVIADYVRSGDAVRVLRAAHATDVAASLPESERAQALRLHLESPAEVIEHAFAVIDELGGAERYLLDHGLHVGLLEGLRRKASA